jgi:Ser/Thr protein kinase RdoA (MazF antagonist)
VTPAHSGDPVGLAGVWATLATSYVAGTPPRPGTDGMRLLGEALGRLHALDSSTFAGPARHPEAAVPAALGRLEAVQSLIPADQRRLLEQFQAVLLAVQQRAHLLPAAMVHGDPGPGNAIRTAPGQVTLINWENAGLGMPLLDLGYCLLECHLDAGPPGGQPAAWHIEPDEARIAALAAGYSRWRRLEPAEQDMLLEGIRFAAAFAGSIHLRQALVGGVRDRSMDVRLERLRNRLAVSEAVADLARRHLG